MLSRSTERPRRIQLSGSSMALTIVPSFVCAPAWLPIACRDSQLNASLAVLLSLVFQLCHGMPAGPSVEPRTPCSAKGPLKSTPASLTSSALRDTVFLNASRFSVPRNLFSARAVSASTSPIALRRSMTRSSRFVFVPSRWLYAKTFPPILNN